MVTQAEAIGTCETCRFFVADRLECHRYPPSPVSVGPLGLGHSAWATARPGDFCGEYQPRSPATTILNHLPSAESVTPGRGD